MKTVMERVLFELSWILAEGFLPGWLFAADSNLLNMYLHLWEWKLALVTYCALQLLHTDSCKDRIFMCFNHTANLATIANTTEFACTNRYLKRQNLTNLKCVFIWMFETLPPLKAYSSWNFFFLISFCFWTLKDIIISWFNNSNLIFASTDLSLFFFFFCQ